MDKSGEWVEVKSVAAPDTDPVQTESEWKEVTIKLTDAQRAELARLGVETDEIKITTFAVERLSDRVAN